MLLSSHGSCSVGLLLRGRGNGGNAGSPWDSEKIRLAPVEKAYGSSSWWLGFRGQVSVILLSEMISVSYERRLLGSPRKSFTIPKTESVETRGGGTFAFPWGQPCLCEMWRILQLLGRRTKNFSEVWSGAPKSFREYRVMSSLLNGLEVRRPTVLIRDGQVGAGGNQLEKF